MCSFEYYYQGGFYYVKNGWGWTIPFIDDLYINNNMGMKAIANELNKVSKTPTGNEWNEHLVYTRLSSKAFHGVQEMEFSNGETISANVFEPLRTEKTYDQIQSIREKRANQFGTYTRTSTENINLIKYVPITYGNYTLLLSVMRCQGNMN